MPLALSALPVARASPTPFSVRSGLRQPVKRFLRFHSLSPWRTRISVPVIQNSKSVERFDGANRMSDQAKIFAVDLKQRFAEIHAPMRGVGYERKLRQQRVDIGVMGGEISGGA